jgi:CTP synthase
MQVMCVEFARHVLKLPDANSTEFDPKTPHPVICLLNEQTGVENLGGTMRLGAYTCQLTPGSKAAKAYGKSEISERHRHRFEVNESFKKELQEGGLVFSGTLIKQGLSEIVEVKDHPWMVGVQFHPEFKSKPSLPHPLFRDFIQAAESYRKLHG